MKLKSITGNILRKLKLISLAEKTRFYFYKIKTLRRNKTFLLLNPGVAFPPDFYIYETYRLDYEEYFTDGLITAKEIAEQIGKYYNFNQVPAEVLDWGCGPARVVRHFPSVLPAASVYGTDYNKKYIEWNRKNIAGVSFSLNGISPPLEFENEKFDIITGLSVFTHFSEKNHFDWIKELHRVLKKDGILYITTQGDVFYPKLTTAEQKIYSNLELVTREYVMEGNRLFSAFHPPAYIKKIFSESFTVLETMAGGLSEKGEPLQDTWIFRRK